MALPSVSFTITDGGLGLAVENSDGVVGLILQSAVAPASLALLEPAQIFNLSDAVALGIDEAFDTDNSVLAYKQLKEFYDEAGEGRECWIMVASDALTITGICDVTNNYAVKLLDAAAGRIKILGICRSPASGYTPVTTSGIDADVNTGIVKAQALVAAYAVKFMPVKVILPAVYWQGSTSTLPDLKTLTASGVEVLLGDTADSDNACVGLLMGRYAKIPVQRNPGRVKDGPLQILAAYLGGETLEAAASKNVAIHDKGYVTFRQYVGKAGYFFTDDPTCVAGTDDFSSFARNRVLDKVRRLVYAVFVNEIQDEIIVDAAGKIPPSLAKYYEAIAENSININMTANSEISSVTAYVDPAQNVLSTNKTCISIKIVPVGYNKSIEIKLGFDNPAI